MKTIALPRTAGSIFSSVLVLGGLFALYYYRKNGGKVSELLSSATGAIGKVRETVASVAPEISTSPEQLDSMPAT